MVFSSHFWPEIETHLQYFQVNWYGSFWIESGLLDLFSAKYSRWTISRKVKGVWFHGCKGTWCYLFPLSSLFQHECIAIGTTFALKPISLACFWSHLCHTDYINAALKLSEMEILWCIMRDICIFCKRWKLYDFVIDMIIMWYLLFKIVNGKIIWCNLIFTFVVASSNL